MDRQSEPLAKDSSSHSAPPPSQGVSLPTPVSATPAARLASKDWGSYSPAAEAYTPWLVKSIIGWVGFAVFLAVMSAVLLLIVRGLSGLFGDDSTSRTGEAIGNIVALVLVLVMVTATLLTMADRKWSALMQDRVGPNRARFPFLGLQHMPLKGIPHIAADVLKMLFKEDFIPERAMGSRILFNLGPLLSFGPAFCLFAVVPVGPSTLFLGKQISLQVAHPDWGILYVFALASLAVFGTALAGWSSNNKLALLGGLRASAQLVSYEVTLGLTLVGAMIAFGTLRLEEMTAAQDGTLFGLPAWGALYQPVGMVMFLIAALAEIKRAPFDTPEGESEIIGYFLEYSGLKSGLFLIAEYAETVVIAGIITAIFLGGYHIPWVADASLQSLVGNDFAAILLVFTFIVKLLAVVWVQFLVRWSFPRFRYDQIMRLGWKMMLPVSLANVVVSAGAFLWGGNEALAAIGIVEWIAFIAYVALSARKAEAPAPAAHH